MAGSNLFICLTGYPSSLHTVVCRYWRCRNALYGLCTA